MADFRTRAWKPQDKMPGAESRKTHSKPNSKRTGEPAEKLLMAKIAVIWGSFL